MIELILMCITVLIWCWVVYLTCKVNGLEIDLKALQRHCNGYENAQQKMIDIFGEKQAEINAFVEDVNVKLLNDRLSK